MFKDTLTRVAIKLIETENAVDSKLAEKKAEKELRRLEREQEALARAEKLSNLIAEKKAAKA